jgi:hypothetical protein
MIREKLHEVYTDAKKLVVESVNLFRKAADYRALGAETRVRFTARRMPIGTEPFD